MDGTTYFIIRGMFPFIGSTQSHPLAAIDLPGNLSYNGIDTAEIADPNCHPFKGI